MVAVHSSLISRLCGVLLSPNDHAAEAPAARRRALPGVPEDPRALLTGALADMLPSTLEEVALAAGLEPATAAAYLADMSARCTVMFNPLTKRYSLPKTAFGSPLAA
ncbi:MAG TPA: hypothetical protein EYH07_18695 [Kiloniellaceae bacterium]|nr:hypothetical protein [Kiloniellaceae bacterium]HIP80475.1 hypothetical protein [Kiloniellaceae bacterium]